MKLKLLASAGLYFIARLALEEMSLGYRGGRLTRKRSIPATDSRGIVARGSNSRIPAGPTIKGEDFRNNSFPLLNKFLQIGVSSIPRESNQSIDNAKPPPERSGICFSSPPERSGISLNGLFMNLSVSEL